MRRQSPRSRIGDVLRQGGDGLLAQFGLRIEGLGYVPTLPFQSRVQAACLLVQSVMQSLDSLLRAQVVPIVLSDLVKGEPTSRHSEDH